MIATRWRIFVLVLLLAASLGCTLLLRIREDYTDSHFFHFLQTNLFLAWVPLLWATVAYMAAGSRSTLGRAIVLPVLGLWLVFLPNAPYLLTDFIHLRQWDRMALWFDALMIGAYGVTGLLLGLVSLLIVHAIVSRQLGRTAGWLFAACSLGMAAFGTYLGRYGRFNSWDTLFRPGSLLDETWMRFRHPMAHAHALEFTLLFAAFLFGSYLVLLMFSRRRIGLPG